MSPLSIQRHLNTMLRFVSILTNNRYKSTVDGCDFDFVKMHRYGMGFVQSCCGDFLNLIEELCAILRLFWSQTDLLTVKNYT